MAGLRIVRPLHTEAVFQLLVVQIVDDHRPDIPDLALRRKGYLGEGFGLSLTEKNQRATGGMARVDREIHTARHMARPVGQCMAVAHPEPPVLVGVMEGGPDHGIEINRGTGIWNHDVT